MDREKKKIIRQFFQDLGYTEKNLQNKNTLDVKMNRNGHINGKIRSNDKDKLTNIFFVPNEGKIITEWEENYNGKYKASKELKTNNDILSFRAFFLDFDLKDEAGKHYKDEILKTKKAELLKLIDKLPLEPDWIWNSRNGFHVYYMIAPGERHINENVWREIENGIVAYCQHNISDCVDDKVRKPCQVIRLPFSYHRKGGDNDLHEVSLVKNKKASCYPIEQIKASFQIGNYTLKNLKSNTIKSNKKLPSNKTLPSSIPNTANNNANDKYPVLTAIQNDDYSFWEEFQDNSPKNPMTIKEAYTYVDSLDMRKLLGFDSNKKSVSSLFYTDVHPSDRFFEDKQTGRIAYYCCKENKVYHSFWEIVQRVKDCSTQAAFRFCDKAMGIKLLPYNKIDLDSMIKNNINVLKQIAGKNKYTKCLNRAIPLYKQILFRFKERCEEFPDVPINQHELELSIDYCKRLAAKSEMNYTDKEIKYIVKGLALIGALTLSSRYHWRNGNKYLINDLSKKKNEIARNIECIKQYTENGKRSFWCSLTTEKCKEFEAMLLDEEVKLIFQNCTPILKIV